ncbi:hypothetical protein R1flu_004343 [Riccia fluitans]|uniref:Protein kinase domain-containing protein n=1 Tax=Riccia fluitans TaxID=41844 RepID=A0ABD1YR05_9MARC
MTKLVEISYPEIIKATSNFSEDLIVGRSKKQWLYKATIPKLSQDIVVVKRFFEVKRTSLPAVQEELKIHRSMEGRENPHVLKLLGFCSHEKDPLLVYEFVAPGDKTLIESLQRETLEWSNRLKIATNIASALETLHGADDRHASVSVYLRNLQASDILLDAHKKPKIADFSSGIVMPTSEKCRSYSETIRPTQIIGPQVYIDPYYLKTGQLSEKTDVYSFGIILMELVTSMSADDTFPSTAFGSHKSLVSLITDTVSVGTLFEHSLVDPSFDTSQPCRESILAVARLAIKCCASSPRNRPLISVVRRELEKIMINYFQLPLSTILNLNKKPRPHQGLTSQQLYDMMTQKYKVMASINRFAT